MSIKQVLLGLTLLLLLSGGLAVAASQDSMPYKRGDCIVAIEPSYSWFNHYARVEAYSSIEGFRGKNYVLLFLNYQTTNVIFNRSIESNTVRVPSKFCDG